MSDKQHICIASDFADLKKIRDFIELKTKNLGISDSIKDKMILAVDEACTNIIKHSFNQDNSKELCIKVEKNDDNLIVSIFDNGKPFDPNKVNSPDFNTYFKKFKKSGLGIYLIRTLIDKIEYIPSDKNNTKNLLKLIKKLSHK